MSLVSHIIPDIESALLGHCLTESEAYLEAGKSDQAIAAFQQALAGRERVLGPAHPDTMAARAELAHAYRVAGQPEKALPLYERLVTDQDRAHGPDHPDTLAARGNLAHAYRSAGRAIASR